MQSRLGQASTELIAILGVSLVIILVFSVISSNFLSDISVNRNYADAQDAAQKLANAADSVYAQGEGASQIVQVKLPSNTVFNSNYTYIGKPSNANSSVASSLINLRVGSTDVFAVPRETVTGSFPQASGTFYMKVTSRGNYVSIGTHYLDASKSSVYQSLAPGELRSETIAFTATGNESVTVTITSSWGYNSSVKMNLTSGNPFTLTAGSSATKTVGFGAQANSGGLYNSELTVNATAANGVAEIFSIPITVDVQG